ncbi:MAG: hypothetical protein J0I11_20760 [Actinobacteria bacterium]|nr:hypothetical protein [Actinomycetota bacterium]
MTEGLAPVPTLKSVTARLRCWSSPWPSTRTHVITVLVVAAAASAFASYAQDAWAQWHYIGHSLVLWIIVATAAALRGTLLQSWLTTSTTLAVAVAVYFAATRIFGPFDQYPPLAPLLLLWIVLAAVGGFGFAVLCLTAVGRGWPSFLAAGVIAGLMLGDALNASIGIPYIEQHQPIEALHSILADPGPVLVIGCIAAAGWIAAMLIHQRHRLATVWLVIPGLIAGHALASIPDLLLHYV